MAKGTLAAANIGDTFDCGSRIITGTELDMFCTIGGLRLDPFLIDAAAQAMGVKGRIVPGPFLITVVFGQAGDLLKGHLHVATDKVKVLSPVFPNDRIGVEIEILDNRLVGCKCFIYIFKRNSCQNLPFDCRCCNALYKPSLKN